MPTPIRRNGRFDDVQVGRTGEVFFKGRVTGTVVRGRIRLHGLGLGRFTDVLDFLYPVDTKPVGTSGRQLGQLYVRSPTA